MSVPPPLPQPAKPQKRSSEKDRGGSVVKPGPSSGSKIRTEPVAAANAVSTPEVDDAPVSFLEQFHLKEIWERLNGRDGASFTFSVVLHLILISLLAIPVIQELRREEELTTVIFEGEGDLPEGAIGESIGAGIELSDLAPAEEVTPDTQAQIQEGLTAITSMNAMDVNPDLIAGLKSGSANVAGGGGSGGPAGGGGLNGTGGFGRVAEPMNAIKAGNFSVWAWPISGKDIKGQILHGEPGSAPRVFQDYHIVIRLRVPPGRSLVSLKDFSGEIRGTDNYFQKIPDDAWYFNAGGNLIRARAGRGIPVVDGTAELLIRVPPAGRPLVRDTITVESRLTEETQKIELTFQSLKGDGESDELMDRPATEKL
ncbi:hypothetical protein [Planctomicrobium sp. SH527]|uniref:hypothetical protein n=1 Tax=Planctomicrobium sp. SH527 TaxID=3448123 RepID=UPI003F5C0194